ncbi:hypothetical protein GBAR_LOCUS14098, partial [Geodia barretti]
WNAVVLEKQPAPSLLDTALPDKRLRRATQIVSSFVSTALAPSQGDKEEPTDDAAEPPPLLEDDVEIISIKQPRPSRASSEPGTSRSTSSSPFPDCGLGPRTSTPGTSTEQAEVTTKVPAAASSPIPDTEGNGGVHIALPTE